MDVGCGLADFYFYLKREVGSIEYTGLERKPFFACAARTYLKDEPNSEIIESDFSFFDPNSRKWDWVVASGIFPFEFDGYNEEVLIF